MTQEEIYSLIQNYLQKPPTVIWGSGATIPYGMPSMNDLKMKLGAAFPGIGSSADNLEYELGKECYDGKIDEIKKIIWKSIYDKNTDALFKLIEKPMEFDGIKNLVLKFIDPHPQVLNIITTNYDLILEYTLAYHNINYTTGFYGQELSSFNTDLFNQKRRIVNIVKVHGSLDWFDIGDGNIRQSSKKEFVDKYIPTIITPGKNKYRTAYEEPYRDLIQQSDEIIKKADSFLAVGFGFNDEHLTPKIKEKTRNGIPIVLITKKITDTTISELKNASKYILLEESVGLGKTNVVIKDNETSHNNELIGNLWQLNEFIQNIL